MSFIQGVDFRSTSGFVTDPANFIYQAPDLFHGDYPTVLSPSGVNGGWEGATDGRDRSALTGAEASLAGAHFTSGGSSPLSYRMDLPATGTYSVNAGFGDAVYSVGTFSAEFDDDTTLAATAFTLKGTSAGGHFLDATGVERSSPSDWVANNAAASISLTNTAGPGGTTIFRCKITDGAHAAIIATLLVQESAGGGGTTYDDTISEGGSASDAYGATATFRPSFTEALLASDSYAAVATFVATLTERGNILDSYSPNLVMDELLIEALSSSDSYNALATFAASLQESGSASDNYAALATFVTALSENGFADDSYAATGGTAKAVLIESVPFIANLTKMMNR